MTLADAAPAMLKALCFSLTLMEEFSDAGDSKTIRRAVKLIRKAINRAEGYDD